MIVLKAKTIEPENGEARGRCGEMFVCCLLLTFSYPKMYIHIVHVLFVPWVLRFLDLHPKVHECALA